MTTKGKNEEAMVKQLATSLDNVIPTLESFGHTHLIYSFLFTKENNICVFCGNEYIVIPSKQIENINQSELEKLIYRGVIQKMFYKIYGKALGQSYMQPQFKTYLLENFGQKNDLDNQYFRSIASVNDNGFLIFTLKYTQILMNLEKNIPKNMKL